MLHRLRKLGVIVDLAVRGDFQKGLRVEVPGLFLAVGKCDLETQCVDAIDLPGTESLYLDASLLVVQQDQRKQRLALQLCLVGILGHPSHLRL